MRGCGNLFLSTLGWNQSLFSKRKIMSQMRIWKEDLLEQFWRISVSESILTCVKNEDIIDYTLLSIAFTASKSDQKLAELSRWVTIPCRGRRSVNLLLPSGACRRLINHADLSALVSLYIDNMSWCQKIDSLLTFGKELTLIIFQPNSTNSDDWCGPPSPSSPCTLGCPDINDCTMSCAKL